MTQCKEIAKQLKKMLSIYSIEEKESELLPEFTEIFPICSMEFIRETACIFHRVQL